MIEGTDKIKGIALVDKIRTVHFFMLLHKGGSLTEAAQQKIEQAILMSMGIVAAM